MAKKTDKKTEQKIIELYQQGLSMARAGAECGVTSATVLRILNEYQIPKRTKGGIYKIPDEEVIKRYTNGESCQQIADSYNVTFHTISNILEKYNIARNNKYHNLSLDDNYFEIIDRYDKAYFLGLLITDGSVNLNDNSIRLSLGAKDKHILEIFSQKTGNSNKLYERLDERHHEFSFGVKNKKWKEDLAKYGVIPQKTSSVYLPSLSEEMMSHLIRGMIDGDGWISFAAHQLGFCGNEQTVNQVKQYLVDKLNIFNVKVLHTETNLWQITWASKKDIITICNYIYDNKQDCYLIRKYNEFLKIQGNTEVTN